MARIVVILPSTTYRAREFIEAGDELGVELIVASEGESPLDMGDRYLRIDCDDPHRAAMEIVAAGDTIPIDGIVAADDRGVVVAAIAGTKLGLAANEPSAAESTRDKALQRERLQRGEVPQPGWARLDPGDDAVEKASRLDYPLIVKPASLSAGQGVVAAPTPAELEEVVTTVRRIAAGAGSPAEHLVVEELIGGTEVAVEGIIGDNGLTTLAIFDKPDNPTGHGFEETLLVTPSRLPASHLEEVTRVADLAVRSLGLTRGPVHVELMVDDEGTARVIEVAARSIGGLCSRALDFGLMGTSLESLILRNAIGLDKAELRRSGAASGVLMIPIPSTGTLLGVDGVEEVAALPGVTGVELTSHRGDVIAPPPEGGRYLGFVFARGDDPEGVEATLRVAMGMIEVRIA